ncbi:MAG: hypothetical protein E7638_06595 [Ruminococcaceae bacterium]|nr:hypothetical protein [Oscillospiraceae bacterium]
MLSLQNGRIRLNIDRSNGALLAVTDLSRDVSYTLSSHGFSLTASGKVYFAHGKAQAFAKTADGIEFLFREGEFTATIRYVLPDDRPFFERRVSFSKSRGEWNADRVVCDKITLAEPASEILLHDDQTFWHVPTNYFIRMGDGGICCGLEYPYWDTEEEGCDRVTLGFSPNYKVEDGEWFVSEKTFFVVYRNEGIKRSAHGPYPGPIDVKKHYPDIFTNGGIHQHFKDHVIPEDAGFPIETLDWGEVWAMQEFVEYHLPLQPLPEDGWFLWQNGWWARLFSPDITCIEPLVRAGVKDLLTAAMYFGHDNHPSTEPEYIRDMRITPMGFPIYKHEHPGIGSAANDTMHGTVEAGDGDEIVGYTETFEAPRPYDEFIRQARDKGIYIGSFCTPNIVYRERPEWAALHEDGTPHEYFSTRLGCAASDEYMDFHFEATTRVLERYSPRFWCFDGRWINYREIAGYHFESVGEDQCYAANHGHPVGDKRYKEWKNIEKFKAKLRARYPRICMEQYYGLKRGGIWSLVNFNSDENYYEMGTVPNNRLQTWHNENDRFRPVYMNYSSIFGDTPPAFEASIISCLSTSYYCQVSRGYNALRDYPECADILKKWRAFADENLRFLKSRRTIFGEPGQYAADGSAHMIGDEGFIFIFTADGANVDARIPMMRHIGLAEKEGQKYRISVVSAVGEKGDGAECALPSDVLTYNDTLRCRITPNTAAVLKIEPTDGEPTLTPVPFAPEDAVVEAFPKD